MKKLLLLSCLLLSFQVYCFGVSTPGAPVEAPANILKSVNSFFAYSGENMRLAEDFTAYNSSLKVISKGAFLKALTSGNYFPLRLTSTDNKLYFKLYRFDASTKNEIREATKGWSVVYYEHYKLLGTKFPEFNFVDLKGNRYTSASTKGKIIVLKTWFIACSTCAAQVPDLNALVGKYKNRKDILFLSLASDSKKELEKFLKSKAFYYAVIPNQDKFITNSLNINAFPTHFIINKNGVIVNVVDTPNEVSYTLENKI